MSAKILIAFDGSECSKRALDAAVAHARLVNAQLVVTYIIDWSPYSFHTAEELAERHQRRESEIQRANESILDPVTASLSDTDLSVQTVVRHGKIANTLNDLTSEYGISQIFVGRQGESGIKSMIFGGVTGALVQSSTVPVTVVP